MAIGLVITKMISNTFPGVPSGGVHVHVRVDEARHHYLAQNIYIYAHI